MNQNGQNGVRKGTREKKRSRYHCFDDNDPLPGQRNYDQKLSVSTTKEKPTSPLEINQIAKLFCKFINAANQRSQDLNEAQQSQLIIEQPDFSKDIDNLGLTANKKNELRSGRELVNDSKNQRSRELGQLTNKDQKGPVKETKNRISKNGKTVNNLASSLQTDLNYHNALNEHVKNTYPNINALSPDMLKELSIPTDMLQKQNMPRSKVKDQKKTNKQIKEESKPFKRQSYHIAIAYHIHLKNAKSSKSKQFLDPTFAARKLREQSQRERQGD